MAREFQREYLVRLPLPLAQLYSRAFNAKEARNRHDNSYYLFEVLIKLAATSALSYYLDELRAGGTRDEGLDRLAVDLPRMSLGKWLGLLRKLASFYGQRPDAASHPLGHLWGQLNATHNDKDGPGLVALYQRIKNGPDGKPSSKQSCSLLQVFDALVQYRNDVFGHGSVRFESFYESDMGPLLSPAVNAFFKEGTLDLLGPRGSRLVHVTEVRTVEEGIVEIGLRELTGLQSVRLEPLQAPSDEAGEMLPGRVAVIWPGRKLPMRVDPLLLYRESELAEEIFLYNADKKYLSYTSGQNITDRDAEPAMAAILSLLRKGLGDHDHAVDLTAETITLPSPTGASVIGNYEILGEIGHGSMGIVYLARQTTLRRVVALKMLPAERSGDDQSVARFRREIRLLARCDHPNIVKVLDSGTLPDGRLYYAMEYVPGCDLEHLRREFGVAKNVGLASSLGNSTWHQAVLRASVKQREESFRPTRPDANAPPPNVTLPTLAMPALPSMEDNPGGYIRRVVHLLRDAALALQTMHDRGIVHRDVKPANMMLTADGLRIVLMDFGLAKGESRTLSEAGQGGLMGTLRYAAPEQLTASSTHVGPQADVRALGCILWELLTQKQIFAEAADEAQLAASIMDKDVPSLRTMDRSFDRDIEAIVARATERDVADRTSSARQLADHLQIYLDGQPLPIRSPGSAEILRRWVKRHRWQVTSLVAGLLLTFAATVVAFVMINDARLDALDQKEKADRSRHAAQASLKDAVEARADAEARRTEAVEAANLARQREDEAKKLRAKADAAAALEAQARAETEKANQDLQKTLYTQRVASAARAWSVSDIDEMENLLSRCPLHFRGWEWNFLKRLAIYGSATRNITGGHQHPIHAVAFSPNGTYFASGGNDQHVQIRKAKSREEWFRLDTPGGIHALAFAPDSVHLAAGCQRGSIRVFNLQDSTRDRFLPGHAEGTLAVAFSPDGSRIASLGRDRKFKVWDWKADKAIIDQPIQQGDYGGVAFHPKGKKVAYSNGFQVEVRDVDSGNKLVITGLTTFRTALSLNYDRSGKHLLVGGGNSSVWIFDGDTGDVVRSLHGHTGPVECAVFSSDKDGNKFVASCGADQTVRLWDLTSGKEQRMCRGHAGAVHAVAFLPDTPFLVSGGGDRVLRWWNRNVLAQEYRVLVQENAAPGAEFSTDGKQIMYLSRSVNKRDRGDSNLVIHHLASGKKTTAGPFLDFPYFHSGSPDLRYLAYEAPPNSARNVMVEILDTKTRLVKHRLLGHKGTITQLTFSPDSKYLVTASQDETMKLWNVATGAEIKSLDAHSPGAAVLAFSDDGALLASGGADRIVKLWKFPSLEEVAALRQPYAVSWANFDPTGRKLIVGLGENKRDSGRVLVWDIDTREKLLDLRGHRKTVNFVHFLGNNRLVSVSEDGNFKIWDANTKLELLSLNLNRTVHSTSMSRDRNSFLLGTREFDLVLVEAHPQEESFALRGHDGETTAARFLDRRLLATIAADGNLCLWDATDGKRLAVHGDGDPDQGLEALAASADGKMVAAGDVRGGIALWKVEDAEKGVLKLLRRIEGHTKAVEGVAFHPTTPLLASCSTDGLARFWNWETGKETALLKGHTDEIYKGAFRPDGQQFATPSRDKTIKLWEVPSGKELKTLSGHKDTVTTVAYSPDGKRLASCSLDKTIKLWDAETGKELQTLTGHLDMIDFLAYSPDGRVLASVSFDGYLRFWDAKTGRFLMSRMTPAGYSGVFAFHPDGRRLALTGVDQMVRIWDIDLRGFFGDAKKTAAEMKGP